MFRHLEILIFIVIINSIIIIIIISLHTRRCIKPSCCLSSPPCFVPPFWPYSSLSNLPCRIKLFYNLMNPTTPIIMTQNFHGPTVVIVTGLYSGAHYQEHPTPILSLCHGIFIDWFIFRLFVRIEKCFSIVL